MNAPLAHEQRIALRTVSRMVYVLFERRNKENNRTFTICACFAPYSAILSVLLISIFQHGISIFVSFKKIGYSYASTTKQMI